jgi:hypothetical protein
LELLEQLEEAKAKANEVVDVDPKAKGAKKGGSSKSP